MMLVGESDDPQPIFLSSLRDVGPVNVGRDVRFPDLLEWRTERSMLRANLKHFAEVGFGKSVIHCQNKATSYLGGDVRHPVKLRLICGLVFRRFDDNKFASVQANKFASQVNRHRIEQLVGKMNRDDRFELPK